MTQNDRRITVPMFRDRKRTGSRLVMLTAYDLSSALAAEAGGADAILVGDSLANVVLGQDTTLQVTLDEMIHHGRAVGRARKRALLIIDMPWMSYHLNPEDALRNAARLVRETGADAVKLEGGRKRVPAIKAILDAEIPVMGHLGLTPQSVLTMGGYKVQGKTSDQAEVLMDAARALEDAGVFGIVLEGMPRDVAAKITASIEIPTIGIGAGVACDGQVLVFHDLLGLLPQKSPKFVRRYAALHELQVDAIRRFCDDVRQGDFPGETETYD
jgi:3-methyl-2-oxobutanoate hydroxymethyltransferase